MNGYIKLNVGGKDRGFKFGLWVISQTIKSLGCSLETIQEEMKSNMLDGSAALMYNAARYACMKDKEVIDFVEIDAYEWIEELGGFNGERMQQLFQVFLDSMRAIGGDETEPKSTEKKN